MTQDERDALHLQTARSTTNALLILAKLSPGLREDLQQLWGAIAALTAAVAKGHAPPPLPPPPAPAPPNGEREHTGRHEIIGGLAFEIPDRTKTQLENTWVGLKWIGSALFVAYTVGITVLHFLGK